MNLKTNSCYRSRKQFHNSLLASAVVLLLLLFAPGQGEAASFQNLNFEHPAFVPVSSGYEGSVDPAAALPGWTTFWGTNPAPFVLHDNMFLDSAGVSILDTNTPYGGLPRAFQGRFTMLLQGGFALGGYPYVRESVAIAQTGLIPVSAGTLLFDAALQAPVGTNFVVSVAGENVPFNALVTSNNYVLYEADISRFTGQTVEIRFTAYPRPPPGLAIYNVYLDDIRFSNWPWPPRPPEFSYVTNNGTITITSYNGPGGAVTIPSTINGLPVTSIGYAAFLFCEGLVSVSIPNSVTSIGNSAFYQCVKLASITIPNSVTNLGNAAFTRCFSLATVTIGNGVTSIGNGTFNSCTSLASITIPNSVTNIGGAAFMECTSLTGVTIPDSVQSIGNGAFGKCTSLTAIEVNPSNPSYCSVAGVLFDKSQTTLVQCPGGKAGAYAIPNGVTSIANEAFYWCTSLTSVMIPNSVTSIGDYAFYTCYSLTNVTIGNCVASIGDYAFTQCQSLTSVTIPNSVARIGDDAFSYCVGLTSIIIPGSVTSLGDYAFYRCASLTAVYFTGNAPSLGGSYVFDPDYHIVTVYYLPGTTGWGPTFGGRPTALWPRPTIQRPPQTQTAEAGSTVEFRVQARSVGDLVLEYQWYQWLNGIYPLGCTNRVLRLADVQSAQAGAYTVVVTNAAGSVTSPPALLSVIAPVERRIVPALTLMGQPGTILNLDFTAALGPAPLWTTFDHVPLTVYSQWYFDLESPFPSQRFYRAWQAGPAAVIPVLDLHRVPAITLTGAVGSSLRLDFINQFGPTDAWVNLATVTLTNTTQLYFDTSAIGQPPRLWRIITLP